MTDTDLPKTAKKRKAEFDSRVEEVQRIREAMFARGIDDNEELPELPVAVEDPTLNKERSITAAKTTVGGYKSALKLHYNDRKIDFTCADRPAGAQSVDSFLNEQIKSYGNLQVTVISNYIVVTMKTRC